MNLDELNKEQKEAVLTTNGPILVLAGAGSGKTKVLTTKIAYLIEEKGISPFNILAITFTNKAAREMKDRLVRLVGNKADYSQISTFHSFGVRILRENAEILGYTKTFSIVDADDSETLVKRILKEMDLDPKYYNPKNIRNKISSSKNDMVSSIEYDKYAFGEFEKVVSEVYKRYETKLKKSDAVDFDDLLLLPIKLFKEHPDILDKYQEKYKYILIDEYQDTNDAQYTLSKMISYKYKNICCVGDNDQSIYGFRGANYKNILNFEKDYKNAKVIKLEQNYRSTSTILDAANDVISHNKERKEKNLWSTKGTGEKITYYKAYNGRDEAFFAIREIKNLIKKGVPKEEIAIIYRTHAQSRIFEEELLRENIPYNIVGGTGFYNRKEIKDILAYLKLINNDKDDISLNRIINVPKRGIGAKTVSNIADKSNDLNISMYEAITTGKEYEFKKLIEDLKEASQSRTITELIDYVLDKTGIEQEYKNEKSIESEVRLENLDEFRTVAKSFEERDGIVSLSDFLQEIGLSTDVAVSDNKEAINLMTVHSVKGLEFDYVFIVGLEEGLFPHMNALEKGSITELEEERRLCYVALTRAREKLYLLNAKVRVKFGDETTNAVSRFIEEINPDLLDKAFKEEPSITVSEVKKINKEDVLREEGEVEYNVGDNVFHQVFGKGKVLEVNGSILSIAFPHPYGIKKLMKNHKSLNKI